MLNVKFDHSGQYLVAPGPKNSNDVNSTNSQSTSYIIEFDLLSYAVPTQQTMTQETYGGDFYILELEVLSSSNCNLNHRG
jgi:hypothetical protein